jgi:hypothetical protein
MLRLLLWLAVQDCNALMVTIEWAGASLYCASLAMQASQAFIYMYIPEGLRASKSCIAVAWMLVNMWLSCFGLYRCCAIPKDVLPADLTFFLSHR